MKTDAFEKNTLYHLTFFFHNIPMLGSRYNIGFIFYIIYNKTIIIIIIQIYNIYEK